ncbi:hypothetical protein GCM10010387_32250 [Streptomyces inusitatus]|uniref:Uncharacterized protein n=1 Tax=Streptomyces inusitatus TaxID=68221 RepID=A0A918Q6A2_9ACTN|nr:hypothetical protein [Streptomyces inusitatus]GGZ35694.1 hypothetical protein GCM10010387_32250 [Streptomyces inusitatus]
MIWWLRAHAAVACVVTLVACLVVAPMLATSSIPTLALFGGTTGSIPVPLVLPVLPVCVLLYAMSRTPRTTDVTAVRNVPRLRAAALALAGAATVAIALLEAVVIDFPLGFAVARNVLGYLGLGLLVQRCAEPRYGPVTVAAVPVLCGLIGLGPGGSPYFWMWPAHPSGSPLAATAALLLFGSGLAAAATRRK